MKPLTHIIVVRRDLPYPVLCAQLAHAAGESFYKLSLPGSSVARAPEAGSPAPEAGGSNPSLGAFDPHQTVVLVKGARSEMRLLWLERRLNEADVPFVAVREPDQPWNQQLMAIGLVPCDRDELPPTAVKALNEFQLLRFEQ